MSTQQKFWNDIGPPSADGETSRTLLPTPVQTDSRETRNRTAKRSNPDSKHHDGVTMRDAVDLGLISSVAASPAKLFRWLDVAKGLVMNAGCGRPFAKFFKSSDHDTVLLKTSLDCSVQKTLWAHKGVSCEEFSETFPKWGTMRNGVLYRQPPLISRISAKESSLLPTPTSRDHRSGKASEETHARNSRPLSEQIGGLLNPQFIEAMQGFPIGWTDLDVSETP